MWRSIVLPGSPCALERSPAKLPARVLPLTRARLTSSTAELSSLWALTLHSVGQGSLPSTRKSGLQYLEHSKASWMRSGLTTSRLERPHRHFQILWQVMSSEWQNTQKSGTPYPQCFQITLVVKLPVSTCLCRCLCCCGRCFK